MKVKDLGKIDPSQSWPQSPASSNYAPSPNINPSSCGLIHWWGESPHNPITSQWPRLWTLLPWGPSIQHRSLWGTFQIQTTTWGLDQYCQLQHKCWVFIREPRTKSVAALYYVDTRKKGKSQAVRPAKEPQFRSCRLPFSLCHPLAFINSGEM
jgi:hypothetical protein